MIADTSKRDIGRSAHMQFILTGFTEETGFRVFVYEGVREDRSRTTFTVRADLSLIRTYGIRLQELPLLCRGILERGWEGDGKLTWIFTEAAMSAYAQLARDTAAQKRKPARRPPTENAGAAWRASQLPVSAAKTTV
jgi:hypothetical protein